MVENDERNREQTDQVTVKNKLISNEPTNVWMGIEQVKPGVS